MHAVDDVIHAFRLVIDGQAAGVVATEAHARHDIRAVDLVTVQQDRGHVGDRQGVEAAVVRPEERAGRRLDEVIAHPGLVEYDRYTAQGSLQETVLRGGVGIARRVGADVEGLPV